MRVDELAAPQGETFKFEKIGDTIEGTIAYVGDWQDQDTKFGNITSMRIGIDTGNGEVQYVWPRKGSNMAQKIAEALRNAGLNELVEGQKLKLRWDSERDTGKGNPMKVFLAKVTPGVPVQDEEPF